MILDCSGATVLGWETAYDFDLDKDVGVCDGVVAVRSQGRSWELERDAVVVNHRGWLYVKLLSVGREPGRC